MFRFFSVHLEGVLRRYAGKGVYKHLDSLHRAASIASPFG